MKKFLDKIFTNKIFLYVIVFISVMTVLGYMTVKNYDAVLFLIAFGIIIYTINKNMSVVLLTTIAVTSLYNYVKNNKINSLEEMSGRRDADDDDVLDDDGLLDDGIVDDDEYKEENDDENDDDEFRMGFRSRYKNKRRINSRSKIQEYNDIKNTYNGLINTIKAKTAQIKEMTRKLKASNK